MKIKVVYQMTAYIEAEDLEKCIDIWEDTPITIEKTLEDGGYIGTEYDELLGAYNAETHEELDTSLW